MRKNNKGYSLIELLVALAVSSIILVALMVLLTQAINSYTKQTALAQMQNDADISLNQIQKNVMEATELKISKDNVGTGTNVNFYTYKEADLDWGFVYDNAEQKLYFTSSDTATAQKSEVCDYVTGFDVRIDNSCITYSDTDGIKIASIDKHVQVAVSITLKRRGQERTVTRVFTTRNNVSDEITLGHSITPVGSTEEEITQNRDRDWMGKLGVGKTITGSQFTDYFR